MQKYQENRNSGIHQDRRKKLKKESAETYVDTQPMAKKEGGQNVTTKPLPIPHL